MELRKIKPKINKRVSIFRQQSWKRVFWTKKKGLSKTKPDGKS